MQFWLIAMACGCFQVLQAMTNGGAARSGIGAIWVGAMSATVSMLTLVLAAGTVGCAGRLCAALRWRQSAGRLAGPAPRRSIHAHRVPGGRP